MAESRIPLDLLHDFGGNGPTIHLAHANGFPPGTYQPLVEQLGGEYHVIGMPARPLWPASRPESARTWHPLARDLIATLDALGLSGIVGLGHSIGAVLTMYAAVERPDLFRTVVLMDPVILPPRRLRLLRLARLLPLLHIEDRVPLIQGALRRRRIWPSRQACYDQLADKPFFANWPPESLLAYVNSGTRERPDGQVELVYPPEWEAHIFATVPIDVWRYVPRLTAPSLWIRGQHSPTFCDACLERVKRVLPPAKTIVIPDSAHMVPLERPRQAATAIRTFLHNEGLFSPRT